MLQKYVLIKHVNWIIVVCTGQFGGFGANVVVRPGSSGLSHSLSATTPAIIPGKIQFLKMLSYW